jgi:DNA-binding MarR family transcriptional regulator
VKTTMTDRNNSPKALARNLQKILRCIEFGTHVKTRPVLTITQMRILSFFNDRDIIHVSDISRRADMSIQSVNNLISRLETTGYVQRSPNHQDRRLSDIRLTDTGRASIELFQSFHIQHLQDLLQRLSEQERRHLTEALDEAARILEKAEKNVGTVDSVCTARTKPAKLPGK